MKIYFTGYINVNEEPDDRGSAEVWVTNSIAKAVADELDDGTPVLDSLNIVLED